MQIDQQRRVGLSLIEVLVVVVILAILIALIVPAVMAAREASRRARCTNNLKQIGLALAGHVDSKDVFPQPSNGLSEFSRLLPYLGEEQLYNTINYEVGTKENFKGFINRTAFDTKLDVFICPSDTADQGRFAGHCNYGGNVGYGFGTRAWSAGNGPFGRVEVFHPKVRLANVRDGTSNTAAAAEFCRNPDSTERHPKRSVFEVGDIPDFKVFLARCAAADPNRAEMYQYPRGQAWLSDGLTSTLYNHNMPPNRYSCANSAISMGAWTAGSFHPGGVNVLYIDGRVSFVRDTINSEAWHFMASVAGGELVRSDGQN